ncbi:PEP-CTERM sorting domain-containing protein [uncultured Thiodictyon sp.]|jgi:hypothetical protein|uniref:PEP-CTERM sorting domain-containing protein n=1 Tax=uncultured Thiodictyon sp. TaxID=1846217 RepID=UPI0025E19CB4|nr:PEP-CTERM sorting domain-containing protein [uncultured Thiodictyon sp.]
MTHVRFCIYSLLALLIGGNAQASVINWWVSGLNLSNAANSGVGISGTSYNGNSSKGLIFTAGQGGHSVDTIGLRLIGINPFNQSSTLKLTIAGVNPNNTLSSVLATDIVSYISPPGSAFASSLEYTFGPSVLTNIAQLNFTPGTKYAMTVWGGNASIATLAYSSTYQASVYTDSQTGDFAFAALETAGTVTTSASYFLAIGKTPTDVPEPGVLALMLIGLAGVGLSRSSRKAALWA